MLKRFMNWLLYRLQKALGAISGKRQGPRSGTASQQTNASSEVYQSAGPLESQSQSSSSKSAVHSQSADTPGNGDYEPSPFIEASQSSQAQRSVNNLPAVDPAIAEPDTHRRLNASSAALPGVETAVPSFPTDVSELLPASLPTAQPFAGDEQLPEIHDLLPAVENENQETDNLVNVENSDEAIGSNASSSDVPAAAVDMVPENEADIVAVNPQTPLGKKATVVESTSLSKTMSGPTASDDLSISNTDELPPQAVLFSFDIIESDKIPEDSEVAASEKESASVQQSTDIVSVPEDIERTSSAAETATNDISDPSVAERDEVPETGLFAEADQPLEVLSNVDSSVLNQEVDADDGSIDSPREIEPLPYPWSLVVSKQDSQSAADTSKKADAATLSPRRQQPQKSELAESERTKRSLSASAVESASVKSAPTVETPEVTLKNGVVKLLFTLKPGNFHGYIVPNDGTQDILFHQKYINSDVFDRLERGDQVAVSVKHIEGKAYATNVDLL